MLCQNCGKREANVRYTQIINGVKKEFRLCSECAQELGMDSVEIPDFPINFKTFIGNFFNDYVENEYMPTLSDSIIKCKKCGMTYNDFIKTGMFGCDECYETFEGPINSLLKSLHGTTKHIGRKPKKIGDASETKSVKKDSKIKEKDEKIDKEKELQKQLEQAIKDERYEDAAKIRDEIKKLTDNKVDGKE